MATEAEIAVFYSLNIIHPKMVNIVKDPAWGEFISPNPSYEEKQTKSQKRIKPDLTTLTGINPILDNILSLITAKGKVGLEEESYISGKCLLDCFNTVSLYANNLQIIIGVELDASYLACVYAGLLNPLNIKLDLVDSDKNRLYKVYATILHYFPEATNKIRLFFGDLPTYTKKVMTASMDKCLIHYNGCYGFNDVIRNLGSLYYVKEKVHAIMAQNTHLRSMNLQDFAFVDIALYALFGHQLQFSILGNILQEDESPELHGMKTFCLKQHAEGLHVPFAHNNFRYPHPVESQDNFLYKPV